jgi:hypothetical protein
MSELLHRHDTPLPGRLTAHGLVLPDELTFEEWEQAGKFLTRLANASAWAIGDWVQHGQYAGYGEKYETALEQTGLAYGTLRNYASVAGRFDLSRRRDSLSFTHHQAVAALPDREQEAWLDHAQEYGWSAAELIDRLRRDRELTSTPVPLLEQLRLTVPADRIAGWQAAATAAGFELADWAYRVLDAAAAA